MHILQPFEVEIANLYLCLGNAYTLEGELSKPTECFEKALQLYKSQDNTLKQVKAYIELGKTHRYVQDVCKQSMTITFLLCFINGCAIMLLYFNLQRC